MYSVFTRMPGDSYRSYLHPSLYKVYKLTSDVLLVEFMYHVFTRMPGESYHRSLLLCFCDVFRALINYSLVC